jgi:hypothetical protein
VNTGFDENETEFSVFVLAVALEMLADGDSLFISSARDSTKTGRETNLLDEHVQVFWDFWSKT